MKVPNPKRIIILAMTLPIMQLLSIRKFMTKYTKMLVFLCYSKLYGEFQTEISFLTFAFRRYCEDPENYKLINRELLFETLIDVVLNDHSPNAAKSLEMKQIALRCLANLACDPILKPLFIQLGVHKILRSCIDDHQIYFDDDEVCFNKVGFQVGILMSIVDRRF